MNNLSDVPLCAIVDELKRRSKLEDGPLIAFVRILPGRTLFMRQAELFASCGDAGLLQACITLTCCLACRLLVRMVSFGRCG